MTNQLIWIVEVIETRAVDCLYYVSANNARAAREMAAIGETVMSEDIKTREIVSRDVWGEPREYHDKNKKQIIITVEGGCVIDVTGLPKDYVYKLGDKDNH